jgi:hypothetical protein
LGAAGRERKQQHQNNFGWMRCRKIEGKGLPFFSDKKKAATQLLGI